MCVIFPPLASPSDTVLVIENEEDNMIFYYKNHMNADYFLMNFMIYGNEILDVSNIHNFESHIGPIVNNLQSKLGHKCALPRCETDSCNIKRYENEEMVCHVIRYEEYIFDYKNIIEDLSLKFEKSKSLFDELKINDYKKFYDSSIKVMINEFDRLNEKLPLFEKNNLYIITSIMNNTERKNIEQILKIKFKPDLKSNTLLIPTLHEKNNEKNYDYQLCFLGSFKSHYQFINEHDIFNLSDNMDLKKNSSCLKVVKKCNCNNEDVIIYIDSNNTHYHICISMRSDKNKNILSFFRKI